MPNAPTAELSAQPCLSTLEVENEIVAFKLNPGSLLARLRGLISNKIVAIKAVRQDDRLTPSAMEDDQGEPAVRRELDRHGLAI